MGNGDTKKIQVIQGGAKTNTGFSSISSMRDDDDIDPQEFARLVGLAATPYQLFQI
jgi:hypothetical protein